MQLFQTSPVKPLAPKVDVREYILPHDWKKECRPRKDSNRWDFYLISPTGKRLRSNVELNTFLAKNPEVRCDRDVTDFKRPKDLPNTIENKKAPEKIENVRPIL